MATCTQTVKKLFYMFKTSCFCNVLPSNHISGKGFSGIVLNLQQYPKIWDNDTDLVLIFSRFLYICDPFAHRIAFLCFFSFGMLPSIFGGPGPTIYSFTNLGVFLFPAHSWTSSMIQRRKYSIIFGRNLITH